MGQCSEPAPQAGAIRQRSDPAVEIEAGDDLCLARVLEDPVGVPESHRLRGEAELRVWHSGDHLFGRWRELQYARSQPHRRGAHQGDLFVER